MTSSRVLIADDDVDLAGALAQRCRGLGLAVDTASTAMEALRKIEMRRPDAAILDVNLPEGTGLAVCEMLSNHAELKSVPVIILTGMKDPNTIQRCHELRAFYVTKCADVWSRVRPLLAELLELSDDAPSMSARPDASVGAPSPQTPSAVIDAVFEALAWDKNVLDAGQAAPDAPQPPWVLCIDDDATFSFGLQLRLQEHGVEVLRAFAGREGYRSAFHSQAQAIILDYELPDGNGDYVLRRLKESPVTRDIPVIVLTGQRDRRLERTMYNLGAASFMNKPYDWPLLWEELQRHLSLPAPALA
jgi:DNA-binding response OmpR family regulator